MFKSAKKLILLCKQKNIKLVTAESCTGGMLASAITNIAGSSEIFDRGFITYSYESKIELLNVLNSTLKTHGAVSAEVATQMARGALKNSGATLAVSITGIAGPTGAINDKPIGLVHYAICDKSECKNFTNNFSGNRNQIRKAATLFALDLLINKINNLM